jgi:hypothetical protein
MLPVLVALSSSASSRQRDPHGVPHAAAVHPRRQGRRASLIGTALTRVFAGATVSIVSGVVAERDGVPRIVILTEMTGISSNSSPRDSLLRAEEFVVNYRHVVLHASLRLGHRIGRAIDFYGITVVAILISFNLKFGNAFKIV